MASILSLVLSLHLLTSVAANPADPLITAAPQLHRLRRQVSSVDPAWIGYYTDSDYEGEVYEMTCEGEQFFTTSGSIVGCCYTGASGYDCGSSLVTACSDTIAYSALGTEVCEDFCNTDTVFAGSSADANGMLWIGCNNVAQIFYYQEMPEVEVSTTAEPSSTSSASSGSSRSSVKSAASQTASASSTAAAEPEKKEKKSSMAWIAGVVVGVLALFAIAGLAFYLLKIRKRKQAEPQYQAQPQQPMQGGYPAPGVMSPGMQGGMQGGYPHPPPEGYPQHAPSEGYASPPPQHPSPYQDNKGFYPPPQGQDMQQQGQDYKHNPNTNSWFPQYGTPAPAYAQPAVAGELPGVVPSSSTSPPAELPAAADTPTKPQN